MMPQHKAVPDPQAQKKPLALQKQLVEWLMFWMRLQRLLRDIKLALWVKVM
jgi:hypothetical protein